MRITAKGRYALATMLYLAETDKQTTAENIAAVLGVSKIYLEQVLALLKKSKLVQANKGSQGGYMIKGSIDKITVYDILYIIETQLFENTTNLESQSNSSILINNVLKDIVWNPLDKKTQDFLKTISLRTLLDNYKKNEGIHMFYI